MLDKNSFIKIEWGWDKELIDEIKPELKVLKNILNHIIMIFINISTILEQIKKNYGMTNLIKLLS